MCAASCINHSNISIYITVVRKTWRAIQEKVSPILMALLEEILALLRLILMKCCFPCGKHLLRCQSASLCPCGSKGLLPQLVAGGRHCLFVVGPLNRRQRSTNSLAQRLRSCPQAGCPGQYSLHCYDTGQPFQAAGDQFPVAYLLRHRQAFFIERTCEGVIASDCFHLP